MPKLSLVDLYVHVSQHLQESVIISYIYAGMLLKSSAGISEKQCEKELHFWANKRIFATFFPKLKESFCLFCSRHKTSKLMKNREVDNINQQSI